MFLLSIFHYSYLILRSTIVSNEHLVVFRRRQHLHTTHTYTHSLLHTYTYYIVVNFYLRGPSGDVFLRGVLCFFVVDFSLSPSTDFRLVPVLVLSLGSVFLGVLPPRPPPRPRVLVVFVRVFIQSSS